ncbi:MAG: preprotein translocase subunit SecE [Planctomycetota bacterium]
MNLSFYKKGQGMISRITAWIFLGAFAMFGSISLYMFIPKEDPSVDPPLATFWGKELFRIPFFDVSIMLGLIFSLVFFAGLLFLIYLFVINKPSNADYLIETEYELRKVSWPPTYEYWGSSVAVVVSVVTMAVFLIVVDFLWGHVMRLIKLQ